jgi:hypothetical protein
MYIESDSLSIGAVAKRIAMAAVMALALGAVTFVVDLIMVRQAATAELSFNADAAYFDNSALSYAGQPAVAAAQSILTDGVVGDLLNDAGAGAADQGNAIEGFRSRLDLEEPALEKLRIRYRDPDPRKASAVANAVASALVKWAPPAAVPSTHRRAAPAAKVKIAVWENPFGVVRRASEMPRILERPARLATGSAAFFFAAAGLGVFLYWRRETQRASADGALEEEHAYTLVPPVEAGAQQAEQASLATEPQAARGLVATEAEDWGGAVAGETEGGWGRSATEPVDLQLPVAMEPEEWWESGAREPEDGWEPSAPEPDEAQQPVAREAEDVGEPVAAEPAMAADQPETVLAAANEPFGNKSEDSGSGRKPFVDPGGGDAEWNARILQILARTSIGQQMEAEQRGGSPKPAASARASKTSKTARTSRTTKTRGPKKPGLT